MNCLNSFLEWFSETFDVEFNKPFHLLSQDRPIGVYILKDDGIYEIPKDTLEINEEIPIPSHTLFQIIKGEFKVISNWKPKEGELVVYARMFKGKIDLSINSFSYNDSDSLLMLALKLVFKDSKHLSNNEIIKMAEKTYKTLQETL